MADGGAEGRLIRPTRVPNFEAGRQTNDMTATAQKSPAIVTADEFLASTVRLGPGKHQLIDGVIVAMAPASPTHGTIQARLAILVGNHLMAHRPQCRVMTEAGVKPRVRGRTNICVPDLLVTCGAPPTPGVGLVDEPILIIEVLSPSNDDETESAIRSCASIPSVKQMLVVDSSRRFAEVWRRGTDGAWPVDPEAINGNGTVRLDCMDLSLSLDDIYIGTHLANA
jgi:Uma2 family endonuclease